MPIEKNSDEDIFMKYKVIRGTKVYKSDESDIFVVITEEKTKIDLEEPSYDDIISTDVLDLFEADESEKYNDDYVETEITLAGSEEATLDAATLFGDEDAVAQQDFYAAYESNPILDMEDNIAFSFLLDLPKD